MTTRDTRLPRRAAHCALGGMTLVLLVFLLRQPYVLYPDSESYILGSMQRGPLYPLFIQASQFLFPGAALAAVANVQIIAVYCSAACLAFSLFRNLQTDSLVAHSVFLMLAVPLVKFGNSILSESLAYAIFLTFIAVWLCHVRHKGLRSALVMILLACLAVLNRQPFFYLYVFLVFYFLSDALTGAKKQLSLALIAFVLCAIAATGLVRNAYNYATFGVFGQHSAVGANLLSTQLYIAKPTDAAYFADGEERRFFTKALEIIDRRGLSKRNWDQTRDHYDLSMTKIYFEVLGQASLILHESKDGQSQQNAEATYNSVEMDAFYRNIGITLLRHNFFDYSLFLCRKLYDGQLFFILQTAIISALCAAAFLRTRATIYAVYLWICLLTFLNYASILPGALLALRFTFYTDVLQLAFTLVAGSALLKEAPKDVRPSQT